MNDRQSIVDRIDSLRRERVALILAHNYQPREIQEIADHVGDSLQLARVAADNDTAEMILFCGVHFMAETAVILRPGRPVYMPDPQAGCPLADMITARELAEFRKDHADAAVVSYVNTSAGIKAESDICCTSSNAEAVVNSIPVQREVLFLPDRNLGDWVRRQTGRTNMVLWDGYCPTHNRILAEHVERARAEHPGAPVVAHPECRPEVRELADVVASTGGMVRFCGQSGASDFIIATEIGMLDRLRRDYPGKRFWPATGLADCPGMKLTTLQKILWELEDLAHPVTLPAATIAKARRPIERMVEIQAA